MSVIFTQHAIDRMQEPGVERKDVEHLLDILDSVADAPGRLESSPDVALVRHSGDEATYLVQAGALRAVLITDLTDLGDKGIVVANVYTPDEEEIGGSRGALREAAAPSRAG
jgi:hypothetical protein